ncbi:MAG: pyruvate kinase [Acidimicrobiales bacterium]
MDSSLRRTKIIATLGPTSSDERTLRAMISAGMDCVRINMSHGTLDDGIALYQRVRHLSAEAGRPVGTLVDLPGPKVRAASFGSEGVLLEEGHRLRLTVGNAGSTKDLVEINYEDLLRDIEPGDVLSFGDGAINCQVTDVNGDSLAAQILHGGRLSGRPGVHIPSDRLRIATPTREDLLILDAFVEVGVDMVAVSFVRSAHDVRRVGTEPHPRGPLVVAKIETRAAVDNLDGIIDAAGAVMIARGDLGNECSIEELPHLQKHIIRQCIAHGRPAITATQMLESMIYAATPTRAEASDVANAVFDGSSAVMLSGETAIGHDPANVVRTMSRLAARADANFDYAGWSRQLAAMRMNEPSAHDRRVTDALTMAAGRVARDLDCAAILCITRSGFTVRAMARFRPDAKILGFSPDERTINQLTLSWGATPLPLTQFASNEEMVQEAVAVAKTQGHIRSGDMVAVLAGTDARSRATDVLRVIHVS